MINYSIIICAYNQKDTIALALDSIRNQIKQPKIFEIVIADDCSNDGTDEYIRKLRYPIFLKYSRSDKNQGRAYNRNRGFEKASGKNIICIDGDMVPAAGFVDAYLRAREEFPSAVILGSFKHPQGWQKSRLSNYLYSRGRLSLPRGAQVEGRFFTSGNFAIDKDTFVKLSGFDTNFGSWGGEDTDFGLRLSRISVPLYFVPEAECYHYHQKSLDDMAAEFEQFGQSGFPRLLKKYPEEIIYKNGWLVGLPDSNAGMIRKIIGCSLLPLRISPVLNLLSKFGQISEGKLYSDFFYDWLFYGRLSRGYRKSR